MISQNTIQQILSRIDIIEIVGSYVKLRKRGANYLGLCPFHNEKSPSFTVSPAKEIYKCFGCGKSGNSISFLMELEKYSYVEALRWLANKYNVEIEETETTPEQKLVQQSADSLYIINNFAQKFFSDYLLYTEEGRDIGLSYLRHRGFNEDIIKKFQLGFNPETKDGFTTAALNAQYNLELLQKSGLVVVRDERPMDNYRGRIIFPIHNPSGKVLGFGARILKTNEKAPKYINTPENEIYVKSKILYGSYFARQAIDKADECLLVEGYTDVVSLHQAGIENVVASGGTSLTLDQLRLIKKYTKNLIIIYDGDNAGIKAALRGLDLALEEGLNVQMVLIPDNEDPDSYIKKMGSKAFKDFIIENKKDFILFQLEISLKDIGDDTFKKSTVVNHIAETISKINKVEDFTKRQDYIRHSASLLGIEENGLNSLVNKFIRQRISKEENKNFNQPIVEDDKSLNFESPYDLKDETFSILFQDELQEKAMAGVLLKYGNKKWDNIKTVADYIFSDQIFDHGELSWDENLWQLLDNKKVVNIITLYKSFFDKGENPSINDFTYYSSDNEVVQFIIETTNHPYDVSPKWYEDEKKNKVINQIKRLSYDDFMTEVMNNSDPEKIIHFDELDENYKNEVEDVLIYLKLKKIKRLIVANEDDMKKVIDEKQMLMYKQVHLHLKDMQRELAIKKGIVYYPFK